MNHSKSLFLYGLIIIILSGCSNLTYQHHEPRQDVEESKQYLYKEKFPLEFLPRSMEIVAVGDSLTKGVGSSTDAGGYLPFLEESLMESGGFLNIQSTNFGVKGHRSDQLLKRLNEEEIIEKIKTADVIVVTIGGNDIMKVIKQNFNQLDLDDFQQALPTFNENISSILKRVRDLNKEATVYLIGVYNPLSRLLPQITEFNTVISLWNKVSQKHIDSYSNMYFVDISHIFTEGMNVLYEEDLFHPNDLGYELIAESLYKKMIESQRMDSWGTPLISTGGEEES